MEFILVAPRETLFPECCPHGFQAFAREESLDAGDQGDVPSAAAFESLVLRHGFYVERDYAERTPALKQVIPYALVVTSEGVLLTRRLSGGTEKRLHDKLSIGIGGHIDPADSGGTTWSERRQLRGAEAARRHPIAAATVRELHEELEIQGTYGITTVGLLNDDTNPVGAVHLGVVQIVTVEGTVSIRETKQLEGRQVSPTELRSLREAGANYETWSALLVDHVDELLSRHVASVPSP